MNIGSNSGQRREKHKLDPQGGSGTTTIDLDSYSTKQSKQYKQKLAPISSERMKMFLILKLD